MKKSACWRLSSFYVVALLAIASPSQAQTSEFCRQTNHYFGKVQSGGDFNIKQFLDATRPRVVLFGEVHDDFQSHDIFLEAARNIRELDRDFNCVFIEASTDLDSTVMDQYTQGAISFEVMVGGLCRKIVDPLFRKDCETYVGSVFPRLFRKKLEAAKVMGLRILFMDGTWRPYFTDETAYKFPKAFVSLAFTERNQIFARNMVTALSDGRCKKAFAISGFAHNWMDVPRIGQRNLKHILAGYGYRSENILVTSADDPYSPLFVPKRACGLNLPKNKLYRLPPKSPRSAPSEEVLRDMGAILNPVSPELLTMPYGALEWILSREGLPPLGVAHPRAWAFSRFFSSAYSTP